MTAPLVIGAHPERIDLDVNAGEPVDFTVPVLDGSGVAQDISTWTLAATAHQGATVLHTFSVGVTATTQVHITATGAQTAAWAAWPSTAARWSLWLTPPVSEPYLFATGWIRVNPR